jgi:hypothetical protein
MNKLLMVYFIIFTNVALHAQPLDSLVKAHNDSIDNLSIKAVKPIAASETYQYIGNQVMGAKTISVNFFVLNDTDTTNTDSLNYYIGFMLSVSVRTSNSKWYLGDYHQDDKVTFLFNDGTEYELNNLHLGYPSFKPYYNTYVNSGSVNRRRYITIVQITPDLLDLIVEKKLIETTLKAQGLSLSMRAKRQKKLKIMVTSFKKTLNR